MPNYQNPYYNPYLSNQYMPSYQNINSYQQPQNNISGAVVNDFNSITANDVSTLLSEIEKKVELAG